MLKEIKERDQRDSKREIKEVLVICIIVFAFKFFFNKQATAGSWSSQRSRKKQPAGRSREGEAGKRLPLTKLGHLLKYF